MNEKKKDNRRFKNIYEEAKIQKNSRLLKSPHTAKFNV